MGPRVQRSPPERKGSGLPQTPLRARARPEGRWAGVCLSDTGNAAIAYGFIDTLHPIPADRSAPLRALIADDDPLVRRALREIMPVAGVGEVFEAGSGAEAIELALEHRPDVVLMDVVMPGMDGIEATRLLTEQLPGIRVIILTATDDHDIGVLGLRVGAAGFLSKAVDLDALPRVVQGVVAGEAGISRELTGELIARMRGAREGLLGMRPVRSVLSGREWEVLDLLSMGRGTEEIADELVLSSETVRSHVKNILRKLRVSSRREAVALVRQMQADAQGLRPPGGASRSAAGADELASTRGRKFCVEFRDARPRSDGRR